MKHARDATIFCGLALSGAGLYLLYGLGAAMLATGAFLLLAGLASGPRRRP